MIKRILALVFVLALVAAACGDSGDDTSPPDTEGTTETTTADDTAPDDTEAPDDTTGGDVGQAGDGILAQVQARGVLKCGVSGSATAFSEQQPDGSVLVPEPLQKYIGKDRIRCNPG